MKQLIACCLILLLCSCGQETKNKVPVTVHPSRDSTTASLAETANGFAAVDISPMDMSYFPVDYPKMKMTSRTTPPPVVRVTYSRPHLQNRRLFPDILKYGEPWRLGANEATELMVYNGVQIQDSKVKAGRYTIYCVPQRDHWTIVLSTNTDTWGLKQDSSLDVHRFDIPISTGHPRLEYFTLVFEKADKGAHMVIAWDDVIARLPLVF